MLEACSGPVLGGPRDRGEALSHEGALDMGLVGYGHKQTGVRVYGCTEACGERGMRLARLDTGTLVSTALGRRADGAGGRMLWVEGQKRPVVKPPAPRCDLYTPVSAAARSMSTDVGYGHGRYRAGSRMWYVP